MMIRRGALLVLAVATIGCRAESHTDPASARRAIDSLQTRIEAWTAAGQADSVAGLFAENGWQMTPNGPPLVGQDSIRAFWARSFRNGQWQIELETVELIGADSLAVNRGTYSVRFTPLPQSRVQGFSDSGNNVSVWRLDRNGRWRIQWDAIVSTIERGPPIAGRGATSLKP
jgi:uncharacterized protein (TIGR02246 family)